ncbi:MAG: branched-chain amino acid ABC transporter permease [Anaerolineae bacterium]|nr:branched-chain amino acid ABC transporter permease [Anaerolineae bacterium]MCX8068437.1 branched-chain amino acid ABC transporter permease [Anaerolineae bacterium]
MKRYRATFVFVLIVGSMVGLGYGLFGPQKATAAVLSGLTLAALYFLLGAGLSLIFGLMDVLNFAHGILFMIGAYIGYTIFGNPRLILNTAPLFLALAAGATVGGLLAQRIPDPTPRRAGSVARYLRYLLLLLAVAVAVWGVRGFPLRPLVAFEPTTAGGAVPTALAQEPIPRMLVRLVQLVLAGLLLGPVLAYWKQEGQRTSPWRPVALGAGLAALAVLLLLGRDVLERFLLGLSVDVRFLLALVTGAATGAALGVLLETSLIRPFYGRVVTQIVLTLGLMFVGAELVKFIWGKEGRPPMAVPSLFAESCRSPNLIAWLTERCSSIDVLGRAFPTYRLFIIAVGLVILIGVALLLKYSRLGMIVRAGVQDSAMVEALGINVRRVFTTVFALGSALAALGGVVAAPFVGVYPEMGGIFQLQAFIAVVIGGMGSYPGTAAGALVLGLARALGDTLVTTGIALPGMEQALRASPAVARASTVLIMAIVLLVRPSGIFGRKI